MCWGGNCQCGKPAASGLERESWRENEEQPLVESVCPRGQLNIGVCCLSNSPLSPCTSLYSPYTFCSLPLLPTVFVLLAPVHAHFQFSPFFCLLSNYCPALGPTLPGSHLSFHWEAAALPQVSPQQVYPRRDQQSHLRLAFLCPQQHPIEPWMYVVSRRWDRDTVYLSGSVYKKRYSLMSAVDFNRFLPDSAVLMSVLCPIWVQFVLSLISQRFWTLQIKLKWSNETLAP